MHCMSVPNALEISCITAAVNHARSLLRIKHSLFVLCAGPIPERSSLCMHRGFCAL